jgi:hypothetical protein
LFGVDVVDWREWILLFILYWPCSSLVIIQFTRFT